MLEDEDALVRGRAARSIGQHESEAATAVDALTLRLDEEEELMVRVAIAGALGEIGPSAKKAITALERASEAEDFRLAGAAEKALAKIRRD